MYTAAWENMPLRGWHDTHGDIICRAYNKKMEGNMDMQNTAPLSAYIKIARPDHWVKNVFIMPGLVLALILIEIPDEIGMFLLKLLAGFLATCFIASANYVINEWLDAEFDKYHQKVPPCSQPEHEIFAGDG